MNEASTLTIALFLLALMLVLGVMAALAALRSPAAPGKHAFILAVFGAIWWVGTVMLRFNSPDLATKVFYSELAWFGIVAAPLYWSMGTLSYAGYRRFGAPKALIAVAAAAFVIGLVALTNDSHHALYTGITNTERPSFEHGWLFYLLMIVTYTFMAWSALTALSRLRLSQAVHRRQLIGLLAAICLPWMANLSFVFFGFRLFNDDPTPFAFSLTSLVMLMMQERGKLFVAPPIARDVIFNVLPDPVIVVDGELRMLELNPAAMKLPGLGPQPVGVELPQDHPLRSWLSFGRDLEGALLRLPQTGTIFEVSVQRLDKWGRDGCLLLVLRDVTVRESIQAKLAEASHDLSARLEENLALQRKLAEEASRDHLTGLHNRRHASKTVPEVLAAREPDEQTAFVLIDLDHFKQVNDRFGHDTGDLVLQAFASILKNDLIGEECAFRFGGEEFLVVLPGADAQAALRRSGFWRRQLASSGLMSEQDFNLSFSAGIVTSPDHGTTLRNCVKAADIALYRAKILGRNRDIVWSPEIESLGLPFSQDRRETDDSGQSAA